MVNRRVRIELFNNWKYLLVQPTKSYMLTLPFFKISWNWVPLGHWKVLYCSKNSENHQSVLLGTAVKSSLYSRFQRISERNSVFKWQWGEEHHKQRAKNSFQRFLCWRNRKTCFSMRKMCFKKWRIYWKKILRWNVNHYILKSHFFKIFFFITFVEYFPLFICSKLNIL